MGDGLFLTHHQPITTRHLKKMALTANRFVTFRQNFVRGLTICCLRLTEANATRGIGKDNTSRWQSQRVEKAKSTCGVFNIVLFQNK